MKKSVSIVAVWPAIAVAGLLAATSVAETIKLPIGQQGEQTVQRPQHGTNKQQVEAVYGQPQAKRGPVGDPPIYIWEYPEYTVYFEGDKVLRSVLKHTND